MSDPSLYLAIALQQAQTDGLSQAPMPTQEWADGRRHSSRLPAHPTPNVTPNINVQVTEFSRPMVYGPASGSQLYLQRLLALRSGRIYTRLPVYSFRDRWAQARRQPTYQQWRRLLQLEANAVARGQGNNRLAILLGDSLSLWFPSDRLPNHQLWLNQGISGDTTRHILRRLPDFARTRPNTIYLMAGVNDLKMGFSNQEILSNFHHILYRLRRQHPQARIVVQSILPTRTPQISNQRIAWLNQNIAAIARQHQALYVDLHREMADYDGRIQPHLTTDGLHLNAYGYQTWERQLHQTELTLATRATPLQAL